jgi:hypothetical protein
MSQKSAGGLTKIGRQDASRARLLITEHILLESDVREVPDLGRARKVHAQVALRSRLRRRVLHLEIIDYYYLSVRLQTLALQLEYVLDLRFVGAPRLSRKVAWRWIAAALTLAALTVAALRMPPTAPPWSPQERLAICLTLTGAWAFVMLVAAYRSTETVRLFSINGAARLLEYTGSLGTFRTARRFLTKLAAHIQLASKARRSTRAEHLRDEMREHLRLMELGVLNAENYEASKVRILSRHVPSSRGR